MNEFAAFRDPLYTDRFPAACPYLVAHWLVNGGFWLADARDDYDNESTPKRISFLKFM